MKQKLTLLLIALFTTMGVWADDVNVTISDQTDLQGMATSNDQTETVHKYGTYSNATGGTKFTSNATSGMAGLTITCPSAIIKPTYYSNTKYQYCLALKPATGYETSYTVTIAAPNGYYIKGYSMKAISTSDKGTFDITPLGQSKINVSSDQQKDVTVTTACNIAQFTIVRKTGTNNATEFCLPFFTVTLGQDASYASYDILYSTGTFSRTDGNTSTNSNNTWAPSDGSGLRFKCNYNSMGKATVGVTDYTCFHSGNSPTYTIWAPVGYYVAGYSMSVFAEANQKLVISGTTYDLSTDPSNPTQIEINGINAETASMQRTGLSSGWAYITAFKAYLIPTYNATYKIKDSESNLLASKDYEVVKGTVVVDLADKYKLDYCSYSMTGQTITSNTNIDVTCTWDFPFEISDTYEDAHWYDMSVRSTWYVTSDQTTGEGALSTVNANALGLATDPYQWAFVGNPYNIKLYNKDKGEDYVYAWTSAVNTNIPTFVSAATGNTWTIKASTAEGYTNAFMLTIPDYGYQVNQFGGEGGSLKIWNDTRTTDAGSAFKVFDVPDDFAEYVASEIAPYMENPATYFNWTDAARTAIGYDASYKTTCPYATYASMKTELASALADLNSNVNFPPAGYYRIKNRLTTGSYGYMGLNGGTSLLGNISNANDVSTIIHLTKSGDKYYFQTQGKYTGNVRKDDYVSLVDDAPSEAFAMEAQAIGYAAFRTYSDGPYSYYHASSDKDYKIVGWEQTANASQWSIEEVTSVTIPLNHVASTNGSYATIYFPFDVTLETPGPTSGAIPFVANVVGSRAKLEAFGSLDIPAYTPVLLAGALATESVTATITSGLSEFTGDNDLSGTCFDKAYPLAENEYVFGTSDGELGFWKLGEGRKVGANRAYLVVSAGIGEVKGFALDFDDDATGIENLNVNDNLNGVIYNLAGQRIQKMQKGINIVNGKKVLF